MQFWCAGAPLTWSTRIVFGDCINRPKRTETLGIRELRFVNSDSRLKDAATFLLMVGRVDDECARVPGRQDGGDGGGARHGHQALEAAPAGQNHQHQLHRQVRFSGVWECSIRETKPAGDAR